MSKPEDVIAEILTKIREQADDDEQKESYGEEYLVQLKSAYKSLIKKESFEVGQLVKWKHNLKNRRLAKQNQPAIVVAILEQPIINTDEEFSSPYFLENLDIILGMIVDDAFLTFYYDSRRFEAYLE